MKAWYKDNKDISAVTVSYTHLKEAQEFVASLKEHLTKTDEQVLFFAFN